MKTLMLALVAATFVLGSRQSLSDDSLKLLRLRTSPAENPESVRWFATLPLDKQRAAARQLGIIVLDSDDSATFVVAFGAEKSPYPWALFVGARRVELCEGNSFDITVEDDKDVSKQQGVRWTFEEAYNTEYAERGIAFQKPLGTKSTGLRIWITGSGWQYVGPQLEESSDVLRTAELIAPDLKR